MTPARPVLLEEFLERVKPFRESRPCVVCNRRLAIFLWRTPVNIRPALTTCQSCSLQLISSHSRLATQLWLRSSQRISSIRPGHLCILCRRVFNKMRTIELPNHDPNALPYDFAHVMCVVSVLGATGLDVLVAIG